MLSKVAGLRNASLRLAVLLAVGIRAACPAGPVEQKPVMGELKLEGQYIERLTLRPRVGLAEVLNDPNQTVRLPVGEYWVDEVRLKGGYRRQLTPNRSPVVISEDAPASLKEGGPLKHTVSVLRRGRVLVLSYRLYGVGGEAYATANSGGKQPTFAIYKGDKQIAAGEFEFG